MGFPCFEESNKATKEDILVRKLKKSEPCYSGFDVIIDDELGEIREEDWFKMPKSERFDLCKPYVVNLIESVVSDFRLDHGFGENFSVVNRPNSFFQFKVVTDRKDYFSLEDSTVFETYYSVVFDRDVSNLIREGQDMEREGGVDPFSSSPTHATNIYVLSIGNGVQSMNELNKVKSKNLSNITTHLVMGKEHVEDMIGLGEFAARRKLRCSKLARELVSEGYKGKRLCCMSSGQLEELISKVRDAKRLLSENP